jgi:hypothetical protein
VVLRESSFSRHEKTIVGPGGGVNGFEKSPEICGKSFLAIPDSDG